MYGKIFDSTFTGSMMGAGSDVIAVWAYVISAARGDDHTVELNPRHLAALIGASERRMRTAIEFLCTADPQSRSPAESGKRLVRLGQFMYRVVNHEKYRDAGSVERRRQYQREWVAARRAQRRSVDRKVDALSTSVESRQLSTQAEAEAEAEAEKRDLLPAQKISRSGEGKGGAGGKPDARRGSRLAATTLDEIPEEWAQWVEERYGNGVDTGRWLNAEAERFVDYWRAQPGQRGVKLDWFATWRNWFRKAADEREAKGRRR